MKSGFSHLTKLFCVVLVVALPVQSVMHSYLSLPIVESMQAQAMASKTNKFNNPQHFSNRNIQAEQTVNQFFIDKSDQSFKLKGEEEKLISRADSDFDSSLVREGFDFEGFGTVIGIFGFILAFVSGILGDSGTAWSFAALGGIAFAGGATLKAVESVFKVMAFENLMKFYKKTGKQINIKNKKNPKYYMQIYDEDSNTIAKDYQKTIETAYAINAPDSSSMNSYQPPTVELQKHYSKFKFTLAHVAAAYNDKYFFEIVNRAFKYEIRSEGLVKRYLHRYIGYKDVFHQPDAFGVYPVDIALKMGRVDVLKHILPKKGTKLPEKGTDFNAQDTRTKKHQEALQNRVKEYVNRSIDGITKVLLYIKNAKTFSVRKGVPCHSTASRETFNNLASSIILGKLTANELDQALQKDFNINTVDDSYGNTLLHIAMGSENIEAVMLLLERHASTKIENNHIITFYDLLKHMERTLEDLVEFSLLTESIRTGAGRFTIEIDHKLTQKVLHFIDWSRGRNFNHNSSSCHRLLKPLE